jgi:hypothetical protein
MMLPPASIMNPNRRSLRTDDHAGVAGVLS